MYIHIYVFVCVDMYICICAYCIHMYICIHTSICVCLCARVCVCMSVCIVFLTCARFWCGMDAEEFALISALNHGEAWVSQMAVTAAPCGYCRQLLAEAFCTLHPDGGEEEGGTGEREFELFIRPSHIAFSLQQLLPMAFGPRDLEETSGLFTRRYHPLVLAHDDAPPEEAQDKEDEGVWRQLTIKALECATRSHSPYSNSPAGVALRLKVWDSGSDDRRAEGGGGEGRTEPGQGQWKIVGGSYYENCAFNPSTSPVKAALVAAVCSQLALDSISHAVLVQLEGAAISHAASTSALIASTSPTCAVRVVYARAPV